MLKKVLIAAILCFSTSASAGEIEFSGYVGGGFTFFPEAGIYPGQLDHSQGGIFVRPEIKWVSEDRNSLFQFSAYARYESVDSERSHYDIREAYLLHSFDEWEVLAGINKVFWGVTESRHLVDIINQVDALEYNDRDARLGQPMVMFTTRQDWGELSIIGMTGFREMQFPGIDGRFRAPLIVNDSASTFDSDADIWAPDIALRYANTIGDFDIGLSGFYGTSREPRLVPNATGTLLIPHYDRISQIGLDLQHTQDALLLKFEGILRQGHGKNFGAFVAGGEYTFSQFAGSDGDLGVIAEYLYDDRDMFAPPTPFDNDLFLGLRFAANDENDTAFLFGGTVDLDDGSTILRAEFERRLSDGITLAVDAQMFVANGLNSDLTILQNDGYLSVTLKKHY